MSILGEVQGNGGKAPCTFTPREIIRLSSGHNDITCQSCNITIQHRNRLATWTRLGLVKIKINVKNTGWEIVDWTDHGWKSIKTDPFCKRCSDRTCSLKCGEILLPADSLLDCQDGPLSIATLSSKRRDRCVQSHGNISNNAWNTKH